MDHFGLLCIIVAPETVCHSLCFVSTPRSVVAGLGEGKAPCNKTSDDREELVPDDQLADEKESVPDDQLAGEEELVPDDQLADEKEEVTINQLAGEEGEVPDVQLADEEEELAEEEILGDAEEESDSDDDLQQLVQTLQSFVEEASALNWRNCKLISDGMMSLTLQSPQSTPLGAHQLHSHQKGGRTPQVGRYFLLVGLCLTTSSLPQTRRAPPLPPPHPSLRSVVLRRLGLSWRPPWDWPPSCMLTTSYRYVCVMGRRECKVFIFTLHPRRSMRRRESSSL